MRTRQKTWIDLLGDDCADCKVDGRDIVRFMGWGQYKILWSFDMVVEAHRAMEAWRKEIVLSEQLQTGEVA